MSLLVNSILPANAADNVPIDSNIVIELDQEADAFTVATGIAVYTPTDQTWIGSELSILDTANREIMDIGEEYSYLKYSHTVVGNTITITPLASLLPDRKYYVAVFPGNDAKRYLSAKTYSDIVYTRIAASTGELDVTSAYCGTENATFELTFDGLGEFDLLKDGVEFVGTYSYTSGEEFDLGDLGVINVSITGTFDSGDTLSVDTYAAIGTATLYRNSFTTSQYATATPEQQSVKITTLGEALGETKIQLVNSIPENLSVNNSKVNPITLKFNQALDTGLDLADKISIKRKSLITGETKRIGYHYVINGNTAKLFMAYTED